MIVSVCRMCPVGSPHCEPPAKRRQGRDGRRGERALCPASPRKRTWRSPGAASHTQARRSHQKRMPASCRLRVVHTRLTSFVRRWAFDEKSSIHWGAFWALTKRPWGVSLFLNLETNCHAFLYSFKITVSRKIFSSELKIFSEYNASNLKRKRVA